jgi:hypothetical protein
MHNCAAHVTEAEGAGEKEIVIEEEKCEKTTKREKEKIEERRKW